MNKKKALITTIVILAVALIIAFSVLIGLSVKNNPNFKGDTAVETNDLEIPTDTCRPTEVEEHQKSTEENDMTTDVTVPYDTVTDKETIGVAGALQDIAEATMPETEVEELSTEEPATEPITTEPPTMQPEVGDDWSGGEF